MIFLPTYLVFLVQYQRRKRKEHVIIAKRDSTKLDALKGFFDRLDHLNTLAENIEKQKDGFDPEEVKYDLPKERKRKN